MTYDAALRALLTALLEEQGKTVSLPAGPEERRKLLRALMNTRPPKPIAPELLVLQDQILQDDLSRRVLTDADTLPPVPLDRRISLWRGDITALRCQAVVNAANPALLGCFRPLHNCIDNVIHSAAGIQLRLACHARMEAQGHPEPPGKAKLTPAYNLPAQYVIHTVGPRVEGAVTQADRTALENCYRSCLSLAAKNQIEQVAFCCIAPGEFHFPNQEAAEIAVRTVREFLEQQTTSVERVIFNVFKDLDAAIYRRLLGPD